MIMSDVPIHTEPDAASDAVLTMAPGDHAMVVDHVGGWYTLDLNVGTAGIDGLGYLAEADMGGLNGPCS